MVKQRSLFSFEQIKIKPFTRLAKYKATRLQSHFLAKLKQTKKLAYLYGNLSFHEIQKIAKKAKNAPTNRRFVATKPVDNFAIFLESRLDVVLFRIKFFKTIPTAREWITNGWVLVNGNPVTIPNYQVVAGDVLSIIPEKRNILHLEIISDLAKKVRLTIPTSFTRYNSNNSKKKYSSKSPNISKKSLKMYKKKLPGKRFVTKYKGTFCLAFYMWRKSIWQRQMYRKTLLRYKTTQPLPSKSKHKVTHSVGVRIRSPSLHYKKYNRYKKSQIKKPNNYFLAGNKKSRAKERLSPSRQRSYKLYQQIRKLKMEYNSQSGSRATKTRLSSIQSGSESYFNVGKFIKTDIYNPKSLFIRKGRISRINNLKYKKNIDSLTNMSIIRVRSYKPRTLFSSIRGLIRKSLFWRRYKKSILKTLIFCKLLHPKKKQQVVQYLYNSLQISNLLARQQRIRSLKIPLELIPSFGLKNRRWKRFKRILLTYYNNIIKRAGQGIEGFKKSRRNSPVSNKSKKRVNSGSQKRTSHLKKNKVARNSFSHCFPPSANRRFVKGGLVGTLPTPLTPLIMSLKKFANSHPKKSIRKIVTSKATSRPPINRNIKMVGIKKPVTHKLRRKFTSITTFFNRKSGDRSLRIFKKYYKKYTGLKLKQKLSKKKNVWLKLKYLDQINKNSKFYNNKEDLVTRQPPVNLRHFLPKYVKGFKVAPLETINMTSFTEGKKGIPRVVPLRRSSASRFSPPERSDFLSGATLSHSASRITPPSVHLVEFSPLAKVTSDEVSRNAPHKGGIFINSLNSQKSRFFRFIKKRDWSAGRERPALPAHLTKQSHHNYNIKTRKYDTHKYSHKHGNKRQIFRAAANQRFAAPDYFTYHSYISKFGYIKPYRFKRLSAASSAATRLTKRSSVFRHYKFGNKNRFSYLSRSSLYNSSLNEQKFNRFGYNRRPTSRPNRRFVRVNRYRSAYYRRYMRTLRFGGLKPINIEVSYRSLTAIYLYSPQIISYPALLDFDCIFRRVLP